MLGLALLSGCFPSGGGELGAGPPRALGYASNPVVYVQGVEATPNLLTVEGGAHSFSIAPELPDGLLFDPSNGTISGTPTSITAAREYIVTAFNDSGSNFVRLVLSVGDTPPTISYLGTTVLTLTVGSPLSIVPTLGGGETAECVSVPALPAGLSLSSTCEISGAPTAPRATTAYQIRAINSGGSANLEITLTVNDFAPAISYAGGTHSLDRGVAASAIVPTSSGGMPTSCSVTPSLPAGLSLSSACVVSGTPSALSAAATYTVTATNSGGTDTASLTLEVTDALPSFTYPDNPYTRTVGASMSAISPMSTGGMISSCSSNPALPSGVNLSSDCRLSGTPSTITASTTYTITASNTAGSANASLTLAIADHAPKLSYLSYSYSFTYGEALTPVNPVNTGGTITGCSSSPSFPSGLSLSSTCVISGTPTVVAGAKDYVITATNSGGSSSRTITFQVNNTSPNISYAGSPFSFNKNVVITPVAAMNTGGPLSGCTASPVLPPGLSLGNDCLISGAPTAVAAATDHVITGANSAGTSSTTINITVNDTPPAIAYAASPYSFTRNAPITTLVPSNAGGSIVSCSSSPSLPAGLSLGTSCQISGTPTNISSATNYVITATNSGGASSDTISITVKDSAPVLSYAGSPFTFVVSSAISAINPGNGGGAITSCSTSPPLPAGLSLSSSCVISGTPTTVSSVASYTVTATNSGGSSSAVIAISVTDSAPVIDYIPTTYDFTFTKSEAISALTPNNGGGTITSCSSNPALPVGLSLSQSDCSMTGTPTVVVAKQNYTITASNTGGSASVVIAITVVDTPPSISYSGGPYSYVLRTPISTLSPTNTGGAITSCSSSPPLPDGLSISSSTCAISGTPTETQVATNHTITATNAGGISSQVISIQVKNLPQILFYGKTALDGGWNGTAPGSENVWRMSQDGLDRSALTQNSLSGLDSVSPVFDASGARVVFASKRALDGSTNGSGTSSFNVWSMGVSGSSATALTQDSNAGLSSDQGHVVSPDGTKIAFASKMDLSGSPDGTGTASYNIWVMNADGTGKVAITQNTLAGLDSRAPVFSPDGAILYFYSSTDVDGDWDGDADMAYNIWSSDLTGAVRSRLTTDEDGHHNYDPQVSPDGTQVVYSSYAKIGGVSPSSLNIWVMSSDGMSSSPLTSNTTAGLDSGSPSFSPDGSEIVFVSKMPIGGVNSSSYNIWKMSSNGANQVALTDRTAVGLDSRSPRFSPDGGKIVFSSKMDISGLAALSWNIWLMNSDGTSLGPLTRNTAIGLDSYLAPGRFWHAE